VLALPSHRLTDQEIAAALVIGSRTAESHVAHILGKLEVAKRREAADIWDRWGALLEARVSLAPDGLGRSCVGTSSISDQALPFNANSTT
jgi:hypothetical protein